ncbi:MAG: hypothetical protein ABI955_03980, partial [Nitrospirota bacterium]
MAARSEAEANSLLVYKSPAWKGGVLYYHLATVLAQDDSQDAQNGRPATREQSWRTFSAFCYALK